MPTPPISEALLQEAIDLWEANGRSFAKAVEASGLPRGTFGSRLEKAKKLGMHLSDGMRQSMQDAKLDGMAIDGGWIITDKDGEIIKRSTRYSQKTPALDTAAILDAIHAGLSDLPAAAHIEAPKPQDDLCAVFPVADLHIGLLTDEEETGTDWNGKIAGQVFSQTFGRLVSVTPSAGTAILAQLGDLTHTDDQRNVTPQSGHQLDADTRYFMILRRAVSAMKWAIDALRAKYPRVIYRGCRGNHDITAHYAVTLALAEHYRDIEGVTIIDNAGEFYCHEYGANMILLHHGDRAKPERLVHFAAAEYPQIWGRTRHRLALSGHVHHETVKEIGGMKFESLGTIIPRDAYAIGHGYSARRSLVSITLDKESGEVSRSRVGV